MKGRYKPGLSRGAADWSQGGMSHPFIGGKHVAPNMATKSNISSGGRDQLNVYKNPYYVQGDLIGAGGKGGTGGKPNFPGDGVDISYGYAKEQKKKFSSGNKRET